jgi:hypothetical protein
MGRKVKNAASLQRRVVCTSSLRLGITRSWVDWKEMGWMRWNRSIAKRIANPWLEFGWSVSCALGCTMSAESDGNERR